MKGNKNFYYFDHTTSAEKVINRQIDELKTEISYFELKMEDISRSPNELVFKEGRIAELTYQTNKLKLQLDRLVKEEDPVL